MHHHVVAVQNGCVPIDIRHHPAFARRVKPTYFVGGFGQIYHANKTKPQLHRSWTWPLAFAHPLKGPAHGWAEKECKQCARSPPHNLLRSIGRPGNTLLNTRMLRQSCVDSFLKIVTVDDGFFGSRCVSDGWSLVFTLRGAHQMSDKQQLVQVLDAVKARSMMPRTFSMDSPAECRAFFSLQRLNESSWLTKTTYGFGGRGVDVVTKAGAHSLATLRTKYGACQANTRHRLQLQELVQPRLLEGRAWTFRAYLLISSLAPLRAFHRLGNYKVCVEQFSSRFSADKMVRDRAVKCNYHMALSSPKWGSPGLRVATDVVKPMGTLAAAFGEKEYASLLSEIDTALRTLTRAFASHLSVHGGKRTHGVTLLAVDGLWGARGDVKLLEVNDCPAVGEKNDRGAIPSDEAPHGRAYATDVVRTALTSFCQYRLEDPQCDVGACSRAFPSMRAII